MSTPSIPAIDLLRKVDPDVDKILASIRDASLEELNTTDSGGYTALHYAVNRRPVLEIIRALIKKGVNLNAETYFTPVTPLMEACARGYADAASMLILAGAEIYHSLVHIIETYSLEKEGMKEVIALIRLKERLLLKV
jgi:ankyrin repeat protein